MFKFVRSLLKIDWNLRFFYEFLAGSLIKLVYFSRHEDRSSNDKRKKTLKERLGISNGSRRSYPILGGRLHFVKFETNKINECLDFISSKQLHCGGILLHSSLSSCFCHHYLLLNRVECTSLLNYIFWFLLVYVTSFKLLTFIFIIFPPFWG